MPIYHRIIQADEPSIHANHTHPSWTPARTLTENYIKRWYSLTRNLTFGATSTTGTSIQLDPEDNAFKCESTLPIDNTGIIVGQGQQINHVNSWALADPFEPPLTEGTLRYGVNTLAVEIISQTTSWRIQRSLLNMTLSNISISEMAYLGYFGASRFMHIYDTYDVPISAVPGVPLIAQYLIVLTP